MSPRSPLASIAAIALALVVPATARGAGAVVGRPGENATIGSARIAIATAAGRSTWWAQVSVEGVSGGFAWLLPVRPGARVDLGSDAWLDALDAATSPVVLPPVSATSCDAGLVPEYVAPVTSPQSIRPGQTALVTDASSLDAFVSGAGYAVPSELTAPLASLFASGGSIFASTYDSSALPTRTVRVVDGGPSMLPLALSGTSAGGTRVTAFAIASSGATAGASPLRLDPSSVLWANDGVSTYVAAREALLEQWQGTRWLTESTLPDLFFDGAFDGAGAALPSVVSEYFGLASAYGDATGDPAACSAVAYATRTSSESYAAACPGGALAIVPGPSPCALEEDGGLPADALLCGGSADDAALAVASLSPGDMWVTRLDGLVPSSDASDVAISTEVTTPSSPVVTAGGYVTTCPSPASPPTVAPAIPPQANQPVQSSNSPSSSQPSSDTQAASAAPAAAEGCGSAIGDACSSSDSTDDASDDLSGCGSSDKSDDDSSSGCGSSDSSSSSGNGCATGTRARHARRSPVSRVVLALAVAGAIARRRRRG